MSARSRFPWRPAASQGNQHRSGQRGDQRCEDHTCSPKVRQPGHDADSNDGQLPKNPIYHLLRSPSEPVIDTSAVLRAACATFRAVDSVTEARLEELTLRLDTPLHRVLAAMVGGCGAVIGVGLTGLPWLISNEKLRLRWPHALWFGLEVFAVGTAGGAVGHFLIVKVARGPLKGRAFTVGGPMGLATALTVWALTYYGQTLLSPLEPGPEAERVLRSSIKVGTAAGPVAGVAVSLMVMKALKSVLKDSDHSKDRRVFGSSG